MVRLRAAFRLVARDQRHAFHLRLRPEGAGGAAGEAVRTAGLANDKLWIGHFGIDSDDGMPVFRHAVLLRGAPGASAESLEDMVDIAITECERFFPAFQFVLWGGKAPPEALQCRHAGMRGRGLNRGACAAGRSRA